MSLGLVFGVPSFYRVLLGFDEKGRVLYSFYWVLPSFIKLKVTVFEIYHKCNQVLPSLPGF